MSNAKILSPATAGKDAAQAALDYDTRGWKLVQVRFHDKKAVSTAWQNQQPKPDAFKVQSNIGVQLGPRSGGLVDIDLDCPQAMVLADAFFPELQAAAFGRLHPDGSHVLGHRLVICPDIPEAEAKAHAFDVKRPDELAALAMLGLPKSVVLEVRAGKGFTVFPPSFYGEDRLLWRAIPGDAHGPRWDFLPAIPTMPFAEVRRRAGLLAFASLALAAYPGEGGRDAYCLRLAGALVHAGVSEEDGEMVVSTVAKVAQDPENRAGKVTATLAKKDEGGQTNGLPSFLETAGLEACEKQVRKWLGMEAKTNEKRGGSEKVTPPPGAWDIGHPKLVELAHAIAKGLQEAGVLIFRRDTEVVRVHRFKAEASEGKVSYAANTTILRANDWRWIRSEVSDHMQFYRWTKSGPVDCAPTIDNVRLLEDRVVDLDLPEIIGMSHVPTLDRDEPGYDPVQKVFHTYNAGDFPRVPENSTKADALAALARLLHHARAFPWKSDVDRAVYAAYLLTAVIRPAIAFAPVFGFSARDARSGKSKLAKCGGILATGNEPPTSSFMGRKYDDNQTYWAMLSSGSPIIMYDNLEVGLPFYNDSIAQGLQSERVRARVLGESREVWLPTRVLMAVTGNSLTSKKDMVERMLRCELDPKTDRPGERQFTFDPEDEVRRDRAALVVDALTILRAYSQSGERAKVAVAMGGFEKWSELVREALLWLGMADPVASIKALREDDETSNHELTILAALVVRFEGGDPFTVSEIGKSEHTKRLLLPFCRNGRWENLGYVLRGIADRERGGVALRRTRDETLGQYVFRLEGKPSAALREMAQNLDTVALPNGILVSGANGSVLEDA